MCMWKDKRTPDGQKRLGKSIDHFHAGKYNPCHDAKKQYLSDQYSKQTAETLLTHDNAPCDVNFISPTFGNIRLEKSVFEQQKFKNYSPKNIVNFFFFLEELTQVDVLHKLDQPLLRLRVGKQRTHCLPVQLFWECLDDEIKKKFPDHTNLLKNLTTLFPAHGKTYNFTTR
jgi:hypothetical protein